VRDQQAFLGAQVEASQFFAGVFGLITSYDNLRSPVVRVMKGRRRVEADRFVALRSLLTTSGRWVAAIRLEAGLRAHVDAMLSLMGAIAEQIEMLDSELRRLANGTSE